MQISGKKQIYLIYKDLMQVNKRKMKNSIGKVGKIYSWLLNRLKSDNVNKYIKNSTSLIIN